MRLLVALSFVCVSCNTAPKGLAQEDAPSHIECFAQRLHSGKYIAWDIYLRGLKPHRLVTEITCVGADPKSLDIRYKTEDSGVTYLSIRELKQFIAIGADGEIHAFLTEAEFDSMPGIARRLKVIEGPREDEREQYPPPP